MKNIIYHDKEKNTITIDLNSFQPPQDSKKECCDTPPEKSITKDSEHFEERFSKLEEISKRANNFQEKDWESDFDELAHAYFEPGDKDYWDGIEFAKSFLLSQQAKERGELLKWVERVKVIRFDIENNEIQCVLLEDLKSKLEKE